MADNYLSSIKIGGTDYDIHAVSALSAGWVPSTAIDGDIPKSSITAVDPSAITEVYASAITAVNQEAISSIGWSAISALAVPSGSDTTAGIWTPSSTREYVTDYVAGKISNVYKFKGSTTIDDLPDDAENGDVYNLTNLGTINADDSAHSARVDIGDNVAYVTADGGWWDKLAAVDAQGKLDLTAFTAWSSSPASVFSGSAASANTAWVAINVTGNNEVIAGSDLIQSAKEGAAASAWIESFTAGEVGVVNVDSAYLSGDGSSANKVGLINPGSNLSASNASALVNAGAISSYVNENYIAKSAVSVDSHQLVIDNR